MPSFRPINLRKISEVFLYTIIILACLYRIAYVIERNPMDHIWSDPQRHWEQGSETLRTDPMTLTDPILYQFYIGTLAKATLGNKGLVAFYTILLSLLAPWVWYRFLRELLSSKVLALSGWAILAWLPSWLSIYGYFMQETLMIPLLGASFWSTWRCHRKGTRNSFLLMCMFWLLAGLTRGVLIPLAALAVFLVWLLQDHKIKKAFLSIALLSFFLIPLSIRSYQQMHLISPHGIGKLNGIYARSGNREINISYERQGAIWYYGFQSPSLGSQPFEPLSDWRTQRQGLVKVDIDIDEGYRDWQSESAKNSLDLEKYLWITKENIIFLFFGHSWPDSNLAYIPGKLNYWMRWLWAPFGAVVMLGACAYLIVLVRRRERYSRAQILKYSLLPMLIMLWFVFQALLPLAVNEGRYRKPFEGMIIVQALFLMSRFGRERLKKSSQPADHKHMTENAEEQALLDDAHKSLGLDASGRRLSDLS